MTESNLGTLEESKIAKYVAEQDLDSSQIPTFGSCLDDIISQESVRVTL